MILYLMKRFCSVVRQNRARWVFIFGVLMGLVFSGGEGIQLFPFPAAEVNNSKITASVPEQNPKSYTFSVFSSRNYSNLLKSKFQKYINQFLSGASWKFDRSENSANFCLAPVQNRQEANFLHLLLVLSSQSDRAPPMV